MIMINVAGLALIALIIWWFWLYKPSSVEQAESGITVVVESGVYQPSNIKARAGEALTLTFLRKDASPCAEMVLFPDLDVSEALALGQPKQIHLPALKAGEYAFHCQMKMYRGHLTVE